MKLFPNLMRTEQPHVQTFGAGGGSRKGGEGQIRAWRFLQLCKLASKALIHTDEGLVVACLSSLTGQLSHLLLQLHQLGTDVLRPLHLQGTPGDTLSINTT